MYLHIIYINKHETTIFVTGLDSTSVEHRILNREVLGSDPAGVNMSEGCSKKQMIYCNGRYRPRLSAAHFFANPKD